MIFTTELVTSILRLNALICFLCNYFSVLTIKKKNRKKKEELSLLSESNSPKVCSFHATSSLTSSSMKKYNDDKEKSRKKREETRPRESKLPRTRTPFVRSFPPASFHSSAIFITLVLCISKRKSKRWRKELPPFHPLSSIDRSIDDSNVCDFLARVGRARTKKWCFICACARAWESEDLWDGHQKLFQIQKIYFPNIRNLAWKEETTTISLFGKKNLRRTRVSI